MSNADCASHPYLPVLEKRDRPIRVPKKPRGASLIVTYNKTDSGIPVFDDDTLAGYLNNASSNTGCRAAAPSPTDASHSLSIDTLLEDTAYVSAYKVKKNAWKANHYGSLPISGQTLRILPLGGK
jgi:hypothetical protein